MNLHCQFWNHKSKDTSMREFECFCVPQDVEEVLDAFLGLKRAASMESSWVWTFLWSWMSKSLPNFPSRRKRSCNKSLRLLRERRPWEETKSTRSSFLALDVFGGLRTATKCVLLGFETLLIEKRDSFSRVNILTLSPQTLSDLIGLEAKFWYPELRTHGTPLHLGQKKSNLLFSIRLFY